MEALDLNKITDEQVENNLKELQTKKELTPEEKDQISSLKEERQTRYQKRIDKLSHEKITAKQETERLKKELEEQRSELAKIKEAQVAKARPTFKEETVTFDGKKFYTDETLEEMVRSEELTANQAYKHQRDRDKAEVVDTIEKRSKNQTIEEEDKKIRKQDWEDMVSKYPTFDQNHPDHDPNDPLYKTANELWMEGLRANPRGLTKAIQRAKQILRVNDERPDTSEEHSVGKNRSTASRTSTIEKEVELSQAEKDAAERIYANTINPATGRHYTANEAIIKATKAKNARLRG